MPEKYDREAELRDLLDTAREAIRVAKPDSLSALLNTANKLSRDLYELENPASTASPTPPKGHEETAVDIFKARMRKRDTRAS
jgi:hypothetical protein|nr:MAG TPA: hypothetical protein [Caudoviricetes sp.]